MMHKSARMMDIGMRSGICTYVGMDDKCRLLHANSLPEGMFFRMSRLLQSCLIQKPFGMCWSTDRGLHDLD